METIPKPKRDTQAIRWCFTVNNPVYTRAHYLTVLSESCKYVVLGKEVGANGTWHFQGYLELKNRKRFSQVVDLFPEEVRPHVEKAMGTPQQAADYCKKDGKFVEFGTITHQGKRTDLDELTTMIANGSSMQEVALFAPSTWTRNYRGLAAFAMVIRKEPVMRENFTCHFYYGKTGTGKTYKAHIEYPDLYSKPIGKGLWFDGYEGEKTVLIDEFTGQFAAADMLRVCDKYKLRVETKGAHTFFSPDLLLVTSNLHPRQYYDHWIGREEQYKAFSRRFSKVFYFVTQEDVREVKSQHFFESPEMYELE